MEMGRRDLRRGGANRFSKKQSGSGFSGKSKKGMLKKLGLANEVNSSDKDDKQKEMVSKFSPFDLENEVSTKKSRLLKKNLKESNGVDHASVPRKLRSAMKKRNLESVSRLSSTASKRLNRSKTGIESCKKDLIKKENLEMETRTKPDLMTKDEEEVAATLSGLAGMFSGTEALPDVEEAEMETSKVAEVDSSLVMEADREIAVSVETKQSDETALDQAENLQNSTGTADFLDLLKQNSSVKVTESVDKKLDSSIQARVIETRALDTDKDYMSNGLELWPGVSSVHSGAHLVSKELSSTKLPPWMGQASSSSKNASFLSESLRVKPRKLKKCASHVYITRLIELLQTSKNPLILNQNESRSSAMSEHGVLDDFRSLKNSFEKVTSAGAHVISPPKCYPIPNPNPNPQRFDIRRTQNPNPIQDMKQFSLYSSQRQSFDFLSLSSPGNLQINTNDAINESAAPNAFPQYHHHQTKNFSIPQQPENFHISAPYNTQISPPTSSHQVQQQHHHSPYLASRFSNPYHAGSVAVLNHQQQQLLQKRLMAAQYRPNGNQYSPILQQSKPPNLSLNLSTTVQPIQRFSNVAQQQHRLMANAAAVMAMNHQNNNSRNYFPVAYEDTRTPLQLLCNEQ